ncbi:AMP_1a_G0000050.mRNA.1.CDS.1 [Saccharomyces cerevisiae]|nr:AMP_1a_G0000050.mRNA.1.CDS.1 [Saccharomyces cerevisiae]CAI6465793.1 AMP_1a_G0000050.mRNA.1.CDS.1 [Saccharomyces cerevisiae]
MLQYIPLSSYTLTLQSWPISLPLNSVLSALTSPLTALASAVYTLCHSPIKSPSLSTFKYLYLIRRAQIPYKCS